MAIPMTEAFTLGFIGTGKMAEAIVRGVGASGMLPVSRMQTGDLNEDRRQVFSELDVKVFDFDVKEGPLPKNDRLRYQPLVVYPAPMHRC